MKKITLILLTISIFNACTSGVGIGTGVGISTGIPGVSIGTGISTNIFSSKKNKDAETKLKEQNEVEKKIIENQTK